MVNPSVWSSYRCRIKLQWSQEHCVMFVTFCWFSLHLIQIECNKKKLKRLVKYPAEPSKWRDAMWQCITFMFWTPVLHPALICIATRLWHTRVGRTLNTDLHRCETATEFYWKIIQACLILVCVEFIFRESWGVHVKWFMSMHVKSLNKLKLHP